jgi:hypothetical protein
MRDFDDFRFYAEFFPRIKVFPRGAPPRPPAPGRCDTRPGAKVLESQPVTGFGNFPVFPTIFARTPRAAAPGSAPEGATSKRATRWIRRVHEFPRIFRPSARISEDAARSHFVTLGATLRLHISSCDQSPFGHNHVSSTRIDVQNRHKLAREGEQPAHAFFSLGDRYSEIARLIARN